MVTVGVCLTVKENVSFASIVRKYAFPQKLVQVVRLLPILVSPARITRQWEE